MYNVLAKYRSGEALSKKEQFLHTKVATGELARIHDELDAAVFAAYGWPKGLTDEEILERIVELNRERATEEARGQVRWLRAPDKPAVAAAAEQTTLPSGRKQVAKLPWPRDPLEQLAAILAVVQETMIPLDSDSVSARFKGARRKRLGEILERLADRRLVFRDDDGRYLPLK